MKCSDLLSQIRHIKTEFLETTLGKIQMIGQSKMKILLIGGLLLMGSCASKRPTSLNEVRHELVAMKDLDQYLNQLVVDRDEKARESGFSARKERITKANSKRIEEIFEDIGYPTSALVGDEASDAFWLLTQHSDHKPQFQEKVIQALKPLVIAGEARSDSLAYLTDRVRINTDRLQVYGTQVEFELALGKAKPKPLENPESVDQRRAEVGLGPLWLYLNEMSEFQFKNNESYYADLGVHGPWQYPEGFVDWGSNMVPR